MINLRDFFDAYDGAFRETAKSIAQFYFEPCITARMGVPRLNATRTDTESFFGQVLEKYRAQGFDHGQILNLESQSLGANSVLATIRWSFKDKGDKTLWEGTFSYNLYKRDERWQILLQTMHDS